MVEVFVEVEGQRFGWCLEDHRVAFDLASLAAQYCDT